MIHDFPDWPTDVLEADRKYRALVLSLVERYRISLGGASPDPVALVRDYLAGTRSADELEREAEVWEDFATAPERLGDFQSPEALRARMAMTLLLPLRDDDDLDELLSWLVELFGLFGCNAARIRELVYGHGQGSRRSTSVPSEPTT